jgi:hypothetical protein
MVAQYKALGAARPRLLQHDRLENVRAGLSELQRMIALCSR